MVLGIAPGIHLLLESQQAEMTTLMRPETRNFNIIAQEVRIDGNLVILAGKKLFLVIEARTPGKVRSDLEILSLYVSKHVGGMHPFSGIRIMSTACGMNVMIAAPITKKRRVNPPLNFKMPTLCLTIDYQLSLLRNGLWTPGERHIIAAFG